MAIGQILLSQGYYSAALAAVNSRTLKWACFIGTAFAWTPIPIIFGNVIGGTALATKLDIASAAAVRTGITPYLFSQYLGIHGVIALAVLVLMAGLTTGGNGLAGLQAVFSVDLYKKYLKRNATEPQQTGFNRLAVLVGGVVIGIGAILLEGISLLSIDIFSGILFASPCGALIVGLFSRRINAVIAAVATFLGLAGGLVAYFVIPDTNLNFFVGNVITLCLPFLIMLVSVPFVQPRFDFAKLHAYQSEHRVVLHEEEPGAPAGPAAAS